MNCKICSPPGQTLCPDCEQEIQARVRELTGRIRAKLVRMSERVAGAAVLKHDERTVKEYAAATG